MLAKNKKRIVTYLLALGLLVILFAPSVRAESSWVSRTDTCENVATNAKYHFYFDDDRYHNINDAEACVEAFEYMKILHKKVVLENKLIRVTIEFNDDYTVTDEYKQKLESVDYAKTRDGVKEAKEELRKSVKTYHEKKAK